MSTYTEPPGTEDQTEDNGDSEDRPATVRQDQSWRDWMMIGLGVSVVLSIFAMVVAIAALVSSNSHSATTASAPSGSASAAASQVVRTPKPEYLTIAVKADDEHGRRGPDGKWHDAFLPADFTVHAGHKVTITVNNYDGGAHTFTSPAMGVNAIIPGGGSLGTPHTMTFTFTAPTKAGKYAWWCAVPCDPWAMAHDGYMRGFVTVKA
jgi:plastocyanin